MSKANVELAHRAFDMVNRRDLDGFLALMAEDVKVDSRRAAGVGEASDTVVANRLASPTPSNDKELIPSA